MFWNRFIAVLMNLPILRLRMCRVFQILERFLSIFGYDHGIQYFLLHFPFARQRRLGLIMKTRLNLLKWANLEQIEKSVLFAPISDALDIAFCSQYQLNLFFYIVTITSTHILRMEVNSEAIEGLKILGDSTLVPDSAFGSISEDCFNYAVGLISDDNFKGISNIFSRTCFCLHPAVINLFPWYIAEA